MSWITAILASGTTRKALAVLIIVLFLLNLRRAGERAGRLTERLQVSERTHEIQRQILDAATRRPDDRDALADRLGDWQLAIGNWQLAILIARGMSVNP
jgi:hypothetical protein